MRAQAFGGLSSETLYDMRDGIVSHKQSVVSIVLPQHDFTKQNAIGAVLCLQFI